MMRMPIKPKAKFIVLSLALWGLLALQAGMCAVLPFGLRAVLSAIDTVYMKRFVPLLFCLYVAELAMLAVNLLALRSVYRGRDTGSGESARSALGTIDCVALCAFVVSAALWVATFVMWSRVSVIFGCGAIMMLAWGFSVWTIGAQKNFRRP